MTYRRDGLSFEYPPDWRVLAEGDICFNDYTYVAIGTGSWTSGCEDDTPGGELSQADPGEVVVVIDTFYSGPASFWYEFPNFDDERLDSGLAAKFEGTSATVFVPGYRSLSAAAVFGPSPTRPDLAVFEHLIRTIDLGGQRPVLPPDEDPAATECSNEVLGRLVRGDVGGLNLVLSAESALLVSWPAGWRVRLGSDHHAVVVDQDGHDLAAEWDQVRLMGRQGRDTFRVCQDGLVAVTKW